MKNKNINKEIPSSGFNIIPEDIEELTKYSIHAVKQLYGDNKEITKFSGDNVNTFVEATGLNLTNKPDSYGVVLNYTQKKLFEAILKRLTDTNYKGDTQINNDILLKDNYKDYEMNKEKILSSLERINDDSAVFSEGVTIKDTQQNSKRSHRYYR